MRLALRALSSTLICRTPATTSTRSLADCSTLIPTLFAHSPNTFGSSPASLSYFNRLLSTGSPSLVRAAVNNLNGGRIDGHDIRLCLSTDSTATDVITIMSTACSLPVGRVLPTGRNSQHHLAHGLRPSYPAALPTTFGVRHYHVRTSTQTGHGHRGAVHLRACVPGRTQGLAELPSLLRYAHSDGEEGRRLESGRGCVAAGAASSAAGSPGGSLPLMSMGSGEYDPTRMTSSDHGTLHAINVAIAANFFIFVAKLCVYFASGSSAMLAESIHSVADVCNQALLRMGVTKSFQAPTLLHPYGYSRDRFVWSLISAVGIFCLGSGVSVVHGLNALMHEYTLEHLGWALTVLGLSFLAEGYSLIVAIRHVMQAATRRGMSFFEYVKRGDDPTSIAIMMEDGGAVAGLIICGACTLAAHMTGHTFYDAMGSIAVGTLLGFIAVFLIQKNRQLLIGRSMSSEQMERVMAHLRNDPVVKAVHDAKSEELGPGIFRFKAEIDFCGETLVSRHLERSGRSVLHDKVRAATWTEDSKALDMVLRQYGREVVDALANEVDRIELELRAIEPGIKHLDLEADRSPPLSKKALLGMTLAKEGLGLTQFEMLKASSIDEVPIRKEEIRDWEKKGKNNGTK